MCFGLHRKTIDRTFWNDYTVSLFPTHANIQSFSSKQACYFASVFFLKVFCFFSVDSFVEVKIALVLLMGKFLTEYKVTSNVLSSVYLRSVSFVICTDNMPFCVSWYVVVRIYHTHYLSSPFVYEVENRLYFVDIVSVVRPPFTSREHTK